MALPRVGSNACKNNTLPIGLGKDAFIENKGASASAPKPYLTNENAVPAGPRNGVKSIEKASNLQAEGYSASQFDAIAKLPSRATLARRWPKLRINRLTWRWRDDASGAHGADATSLLAFLGEGAR